MSIIDTHQVVRMKQVSDELQLSGAIIDNKLKYVAGAFYFKSSPNGLGGFQGLTDDVFNGLNDTTLANYLTEESKALYGQLDYDLSGLINGLGVTAGYRSEEHTSELHSLMRISYAVFCLKKKKQQNKQDKDRYT